MEKKRQSDDSGYTAFWEGQDYNDTKTIIMTETRTVVARAWEE